MESKQRRLFLVMLVGAVILASSLFSYWQKHTTPATVSTGNASTEQIASASKSDGGQLVIYVSGAVNNPGLLKVPAGSRALDAINSAGGLAPGADNVKVNMAQSLKDGMHIHVPVVVNANNGVVGTGAAKDTGKININTADKSELDKLPGIGPALAERIVDYRQSIGGFKSIEELKKVPGIGEAKFNQLKEKITL